MLTLLDHGSRTNERDKYMMLYNLSGESAHELHCFEVGHIPRRGVRKHEISSPGQLHSKHRIHVDLLGS
jgi:hypothetical protein